MHFAFYSLEKFLISFQSKENTLDVDILKLTLPSIKSTTEASRQTVQRIGTPKRSPEVIEPLKKKITSEHQNKSGRSRKRSTSSRSRSLSSSSYSSYSSYHSHSGSPTGSPSGSSSLSRSPRSKSSTSQSSFSSNSSHSRARRHRSPHQHHPHRSTHRRTSLSPRYEKPVTGRKYRFGGHSKGIGPSLKYAERRSPSPLLSHSTRSRNRTPTRGRHSYRSIPGRHSPSRRSPTMSHRTFSLSRRSPPLSRRSPHMAQRIPLIIHRNLPRRLPPSRSPIPYRDSVSRNIRRDPPREFMPPPSFGDLGGRQHSFTPPRLRKRRRSLSPLFVQQRSPRRKINKISPVLSQPRGFLDNEATKKTIVTCRRHKELSKRDPPHYCSQERHCRGRRRGRSEQQEALEQWRKRKREELKFRNGEKPKKIGRMSSTADVNDHLDL